MATQEAIAIIRANALRDLKRTGADIAESVGIEPPKLEFFYNDKSYQQAQELAALVEFHARLLTALQAPTEGDTHVIEPSVETVAKRRPARTAVS